MEIKKNFVGGKMNKDLDVRLIPDGEYVDARNILVSNSEGSETGLVQNSFGIDKITSLSLPSDAETIGSTTDEANECLYWLVTSSVGNFIYEYDVLQNGLVTTVLSDTRPTGSNVLNFNPQYKITGINVIYNSFNQEKLLVWTDDLNSIRCVNIKRAKSLPVNGFESKDISLYKRPPFEAPTCTPALFGDGVENNMEERFLSFGYRYKYLDGEYSAVSAFSNPQFYPKDFSLNFSTQENDGMINSFNAVNIKFNTGDKNVTDIQLVFKESNSNNIYIIETFNKKELDYTDNYPNASFLFSNNKIYSVLPEDEVNRLFDNVPLVAKAQDFISNRLIYGNYVEGRDIVDSNDRPITIDFNTSFISENLSDNNSTTSLSTTNIDKDTLTFEILPALLKKGNIISASFRAVSPDPYFGNYFSDLTFYLDRNYNNAQELSLSPEFINFINVIASKNFELSETTPNVPANEQPSYAGKFANGFKILSSGNINRIKLRLPFIEYQTWDNNPSLPKVLSYEKEYFGIKSGTEKVIVSSGGAYNSCKSNRSYETGIVYLDEEGRYSTVITNKNNNVFIPIKNSISKNTLQLDINHKPPYWANRYKIFVKDSKLEYQTIYGVFAYQDGAYLWIRLEGQDKQKVREGDFLILKRNIQGPLEDVIKLQVLDYVSEPSDFIKDNKNSDNQDIIEKSGVYIKVKASGGINIDNIENNYTKLENYVANTGSGFYNYGGPLSIDISTTSTPLNQDIPIISGSKIDIEILNHKGGSSGGSEEFKQSYISTNDYANFEEWFQTECNALGDFEYEFVRGYRVKSSNNVIANPALLYSGLVGQVTYLTTGYGSLTNVWDVFAENPTGNLYLKIKNLINGNGQNRSFLDVVITITQGINMLIFETDPKDNTSEVYYETQDTYLIEGGVHKSRPLDNPLDVNQVLGSNPATINLNFFNCFTQGNGAESYIIKDAFNRNYLSNNSRPNAVQIDGYKKRRNIASLTYSGAFDKTISYNSLNEFNLSRANYKDLDDSYGSIQKIHARDTDLTVFQEDKIHKILYNKNVLTDAVGGGQVTSIENVLGQEVPYSGEWGIGKSPESFSYYANAMYFADSPKGVVLRLSTDGLEPISRYGMKDWFRDNLNASKYKYKIGGYDPLYDNYILSFTDITIARDIKEVDCGEVLNSIPIAFGESFSYKIDLGDKLGDFIINYDIAIDGVLDMSVDFDGDITLFSDLIRDGFVVVDKKTTYGVAIVTLSNIGEADTTTLIENDCITIKPIQTCILVANDDADVSKSMINKYSYESIDYGYTGGYSVSDTFDISGVTRFEINDGLEGEGQFPFENSTVRVSSVKVSGEFTQCNKLGYLISNVVYDAQGVLDNAVYPTVINSGDENYIEFLFTRMGSEILYLVYDYIDNVIPIMSTIYQNAIGNGDVTFNALAAVITADYDTIEILSDGSYGSSVVVGENITYSNTYDPNNVEDQITYRVSYNGCYTDIVVNFLVTELVLKNFYFEGIWENADTVHDPSTNSWVDWYDIYGVITRTIIGGIEEGCQLISASSIANTNGCTPCTP